MFSKWKNIAESETERADQLQIKLNDLEKQLKEALSLSEISPLIGQIMSQKASREESNLPCTFVHLSLPAYNQIKNDVSTAFTMATSKRNPDTLFGMKVQISDSDNITIK